jgi:hypothetical protein
VSTLAYDESDADQPGAVRLFVTGGNAVWLDYAPSAGTRSAPASLKTACIDGTQ